MAGRKSLFHLKLSLFSLSIGLLISPAALAQERCSDVYTSQQQLYSADYIPYIQARLGGRAASWHQLFLKYHEGNKPLNELLALDGIFGNLEARSWLSRQANAFRFVRVENIARTLDRVFVDQIDLSQIKSWNQLSLQDRRALLLVVFKKWWWEVDSHNVVGFSRWTDVSYLLSRSLAEPMAPGRLDTRLHELLATPSQNSFLPSLIRNFRSEIRTLEALKGQPNAREGLIETLTQRIDFLKQMRADGQVPALRGNLLEIQILRSAVLRSMMQKERALKSEEIKELAREQGLSPNLATEMYWGQLGMSLIPNMNTLVNVAIDMAITTALAIVISQYLFDDLANEEIYQGDFNDLFSVTPMSED